jgi:hypothetical protein
MTRSIQQHADSLVELVELLAIDVQDPDYPQLDAELQTRVAQAVAKLNKFARRLHRELDRALVTFSANRTVKGRAPSKKDLNFSD